MQNTILPERFPAGLKFQHLPFPCFVLLPGTGGLDCCQEGFSSALLHAGLKHTGQRLTISRAQTERGAGIFQLKCLLNHIENWPRFRPAPSHSARLCRRWDFSTIKVQNGWVLHRGICLPGAAGNFSPFQRSTAFLSPSVKLITFRLSLPENAPPLCHEMPNPLRKAASAES